MGSIVLGVMVALFVSGPAPIEDATETATRLLKQGSAMFDAKDAAGLAAQYASDAEITLLAKQDDRWQSHQFSGKEQIRKSYTDLFREASTIQSKNVVEYARFVGPDLLVIGGTFEPNLGEQLILQFVQVRVKEADGVWRIRNLQLFSIPTS